jgi:hypothetical protein
MIGEWLTIMCAHVHTCNAFLKKKIFFFLCYFSKIMIKTKKKTKTMAKYFSLWEKPFIVLNL